MFVITTSSQVSKMIEILSIVGEFPFSAIRMLGKRNYIYNQMRYLDHKAIGSVHRSFQTLNE